MECVTLTVTKYTDSENDQHVRYILLDHYLHQSVVDCTELSKLDKHFDTSEPNVSHSSS